MKDQIQSERGFRDIFVPEARMIERMIEGGHGLFRRYGYSPLYLPLVEPAELFARSVGAGTDILEKEMFFVGSGHVESPVEFRRLCLRPEGTAAAARAYIERGFGKSDPLQKFYYSGAMFRNERPQKGRFRQFHQVGAEILGAASPPADAELILLLWEYLAEWTPAEGLRLRVNSLGCTECRPAFKTALKNALFSQKDSLCDECRRRIETNPLRVLDCKKESCAPTIRAAPDISGYLCESCRAHFNAVLDTIRHENIPAQVDSRLVRGLDYYTRTVFEVEADGLGAQNAVGAGGRYDGLVEALGGPPTPAAGFAVGIERLALLSKRIEPAVFRIFVASTGDGTRQSAFEWAQRLRRELGADGGDITVLSDLESKSLKGQMRRAEALGCATTIIMGEEELKQGKAVVRDMREKAQVEVPLEGLAGHLRGLIGG